MGKRCYFQDWQLETGKIIIIPVLGASVPDGSWNLAGQIVIKKTGNSGLNLAALHIAAHMQLEHPFYFKLSDGDKDTFVSIFILFCQALY